MRAFRRYRDMLMRNTQGACEHPRVIHLHIELVEPSIVKAYIYNTGVISYKIWHTIPSRPGNDLFAVVVKDKKALFHFYPDVDFITARRLGCVKCRIQVPCGTSDLYEIMIIIKKYEENPVDPLCMRCCT